jgi:hypothetical protein
LYNSDGQEDSLSAEGSDTEDDPADSLSAEGSDTEDDSEDSLSPEGSDTEDDLEELGDRDTTKRFIIGTLPEDHPSNDYYIDGIEGLAGIVSFRLKQSHPELSVRGQLSPLPLFLEPYSKLGRAVPRANFVHQCLMMDSMFIALHGDSISQEFGIIAQFKELTKKIELTSKVKRLFGMLRLRIRIRCINQIKNKNKDQVPKVNNAASGDKNSRVAKVNKIWKS